MNTETNFAEGASGDEAVYWLWKQWANVLRVRNDGIPIVGFTWSNGATFFPLRACACACACPCTRPVKANGAREPRPCRWRSRAARGAAKLAIDGRGGLTNMSGSRSA